jgi:hypothetical protein
VTIDPEITRTSTIEKSNLRESEEIKSLDIVVKILIGNGGLGLKEVGFRTGHVPVSLSFEFIIVHLESHIPICRVARVFYINFENVNNKNQRYPI